ncbi:HTH DNA binding domain protein [Halalkalicoccus paucihalophilus]|uniref:HTH DNA binding domain protein n=1 Tax=Halalkalicoccus paucihalophilus TaxID=1008153 RepID=A0A151A8C6_9EURY|nr:helix-turn-helix domain-containing protein [Halalkalicoccus paucihalophilus]KYH23885.1 HTH DNA binding domain protein [Halalkalicoccus paucihalophilus]
MASIIELRLPLEQFALAHTFDVMPELHVGVERFAGQNEESTMSFVWVATGDFEAFEDALVADPSVSAFSSVADCDDECLYRIKWAEEAEAVARLVLTEDGEITAASTSGESWEFQIMCPDHSSLSKIYVCCEDYELSPTVDAIYDLGGNKGSVHGLTELQYTSLVTAKEMGYYNVPREITLTELADELEVSHQALSDRLRRAHGRLIDRALNANDRTRIESPSLEQ